VSRRALVIGGSLSGLFAATLLRHAGWDVAVYERSSVPLSGRGAGIVTHPALADALVRAGVTAAELGVAVPGRVVFAPDGDILAQHDAPQVLTSWSRLYALLDAALPAHLVHRGWALDQISQDGSAVVAHFANGEQARGDILIGADGFRSAVRRAVLPTVCPSYAGYIAWRGLADEAALPAATHAALFGRFAFCLPDGEQILGYPIAGDGEDMRPGRRRYNVVWYRPANDATLQDMLTDDSGRVRRAPARRHGCHESSPGRRCACRRPGDGPDCRRAPALRSGTPACRRRGRRQRPSAGRIHAGAVQLAIRAIRGRALSYAPGRHNRDSVDHGLA